MILLRGAAALAVMMLVAAACSADRRAIRLRTVVAALACQIAIGALVLYLPAGVSVLAALARGVDILLGYGQKGTDFLFGGLVDPRMNELFGDKGYVFALRVLPSIIYVSALVAVLYHLGIMQRAARLVGALFRKLLGVSAVESFSAVTTIFLGQNDLPIVIRPYLRHMSRAELMCAMSSGVASIAASMLAAYAGLGVKLDYLIAASFMAIPGGVLYAKLLMPTPEGEIDRGLPALDEQEKRAASVIEAAAIGATNGARIAFSIAVMLVAFIGLIALLNGCLSGLFGVTMENLFGALFAPLAWLLGVPVEADALVGQVIGQKLVFNEFVAYVSLSPYLKDAGPMMIDEHTKAIASFALCGFANFTSIAVLLGCFGGAIPERRAEIAQLGFRAVLAGTLSNLTSACIAGFFLQRIMMNELLSLSSEVADALAERKPVVALESTIITHGMPYPQNLDMARRVEATVRSKGAVPATIAVMDGRLMVGLDVRSVERLAQEGKKAAKASRRDMGPLLAQKRIAGTTVATTMQIAALAGIEVFATGGIGGVHRGAEQTFDISADLLELARTPVAVVCAGAKSILDIGKTLEVLETHGVPVLGYRTDEFPAFFTRSSGFPVDHRMNNVEEIAEVMVVQRKLGMTNGLLVANPIPEADSLDAAAIETRIAEAVAQAEREGVSGKALTPYLLQRIFELTEGRSLTANIALVLNNAAVAAELAVALYNRHPRA